MANQIISGDDISVHARGSLVVALTAKDEAGDTIDISTWTVRFEVDGVPLSVLFGPNPDVATGLLLKLTRTQIASLKTKATQYSIINENNLGVGLPFTMREGKIKRIGYVGEPDEIDEGTA